MSNLFGCCGALPRWHQRRRRASWEGMMLSNTLVTVAIGAVAVVLMLGLLNMLRGGNANTAQKLMRLRVVLQFIAILVILGVVWWRAKGG
jgi:ABC-type nickel/cobalt efflux system permease component RcnA